VTFENPSPFARNVRLLASIGTGAASPARVVVAYPDGVARDLAVGAEPVAIGRSLALPPGRSWLQISTDAPSAPTAPTDNRSPLYARVVDLRMIDDSFPTLSRRPRFRALLAVTIQ
jgi:hypothetical protein